MTIKKLFVEYPKEYGILMIAVKAFLKRSFPDLYAGLGEARLQSRSFLQHYLPVLLRGGRANPFEQIRIEASSICNLRCQHCPTGTWSNQQRNFRGLLDPGLFENLIGQLKEMPQVQGACMYFGGEALINKKLPEMLLRLKQETNIKHTWLSTNGMLLDEEMALRLVASGVDKMAISIDGRSPEDNDRLRLGASYVKVRENALRFKKLAEGLPIQVRIDNSFVAHEGEFVDYCFPEVPGFIREDFPGFVHNSIYAKRWPLIDEELSSYAALRFARWRGYKTVCMEPFKEICVRANGDVVPCCYDITSHLVLGNAKEQSLLEIWNGKPYRKLRQSIASNGIIGGLPRLCRECVIQTQQILTVPANGGGRELLVENEPQE